MNHKNQRQNGVLSSLVGEHTPAKRGGLSYSGLALCYLFVSFLFLLAVGEKKGEWVTYASYLATSLSFLLAVVWYFSYTKTKVKDFFKTQRCAPKYYLVALLLQFGLLALGELNVYVLKALEGAGYENSEIVLPDAKGWGFVGTFLTIALLPALLEELFFRGVLQRELREFSLFGQVLLCGGVFALYHQNPAQTVYQFVCGACFALVAARAGSFFPTVLSHLLNNGLIVVLYACGVEGYPLPMYWIILIGGGISLVATLVYLLFFDGKKGAEAKKERKSKGSYLEFFACACVGIVLFFSMWLATLLAGF